MQYFTKLEILQKPSGKCDNQIINTLKGKDNFLLKNSESMTWLADLALRKIQLIQSIHADIKLLSSGFESHDPPHFKIEVDCLCTLHFYGIKMEVK